jgi:hypothetical protein
MTVVVEGCFVHHLGFWLFLRVLRKPPNPQQDTYSPLGFLSIHLTDCLFFVASLAYQILIIVGLNIRGGTVSELDRFVKLSLNLQLCMEQCEQKVAI